MKHVLHFVPHATDQPNKTAPPAIQTEFNRAQVVCVPLIISNTQQVLHNIPKRFAGLVHPLAVLVSVKDLHLIAPNAHLDIPI